MLIRFFVLFRMTRSEMIIFNYSKALLYNASMSSMEVGRGLPPVHTSLNASTANVCKSSLRTPISFNF